MRVILIAAMAEDRTIGRGGALPWEVPEEYAHYLELVNGAPVIMGRRSFGVFGDDLPESTIIVLSRSRAELPGAQVVASLDDALARAGELAQEVFVAGGGTVYAAALERADALYLSTIKGDFEGDTHFPAFDPADWTLAEEVDHGRFVFRHWVRGATSSAVRTVKSVTRGDSPWARLGGVAPSELGAQRLNLHWAAQLVGQTGRLLVAPAGDDSHTNLLWSRRRHGFVGRRLPSGHRVALDVERLRVGLVDAGGAEGAGLELAGLTLEEGFRWLQAELAAAGNDLGEGLSVPTYELPEHAVGRGGEFLSPVPQALGELANWYANASAVLESVRAEREGASEVRCWPHHFDIATLIGPDAESATDDAETARSVGVGLSPGDRDYAQPYFYVSPWPRPASPVGPDLPGGAHWHREGWFGAVLTGERVVAAGGAEAQRRRASDALRAATEAALAMLGP